MIPGCTGSTRLRDTDRIGSATLNTNQNISGMLARLGAGEDARFGLWVALCFAVLGLTVWAVLRLQRGGPDSDSANDNAVLAVICVAMFGLVVSPVSWSHHWVWALPTVVVAVVVGLRRHHVAPTLVGLAGLALTIWTPITLMPEHQETAALLWRRLAGGSYLWWALAVIIAAGTAPAARATVQGARPARPAAGRGEIDLTGLRGDRGRAVGPVRPAASDRRRTGRRTLTGQLHQFVHHLVDDGPLDEPVAGQSLEPAEIHRLAEPDLDAAEVPHLAAGGLTTSVPIIATGMTGTPLSRATLASPVLPLYSRPSGERVPSGYMPSSLPSARIRCAVVSAACAESASVRSIGTWPVEE